jgi:hypothetical protein
MSKAILEFDLDDFKDRRNFDRAIKGNEYLDCLNSILDLSSAFSRTLYIEMLTCVNDAGLLNEVNCHHYDEWNDYVKGKNK